MVLWVYWTVLPHSVSSEITHMAMFCWLVDWEEEGSCDLKVWRLGCGALGLFHLASFSTRYLILQDLSQWPLPPVGQPGLPYSTATVFMLKAKAAWALKVPGSRFLLYSSGQNNSQNHPDSRSRGNKLLLEKRSGLCTQEGKELLVPIFVDVGHILQIITALQGQSLLWTLLGILEI